MTQRVWPPAFPLDPDARVLPAPLAAALASTGAVAPVILLVAGPHALEGQWAPQIAVSLAEAWSREGPRLVLADLGVGTPTLDRLVGEPNDEGLADVFVYGASLRRVIRGSATRGFGFIPAGSAPVDSEAVLTDNGWRQVIAHFFRDGAVLLCYTPWSAAGLGALATRLGAVITLATPEDLGTLESIIPSDASILAVVGPPPLAARPAVEPEPVAVEPEPVAVQAPLALLAPTEAGPSLVLAPVTEAEVPYEMPAGEAAAVTQLFEAPAAAVPEAAPEHVAEATPAEPPAEAQPDTSAAGVPPAVTEEERRWMPPSEAEVDAGAAEAGADFSTASEAGAAPEAGAAAGAGAAPEGGTAEAGLAAAAAEAGTAADAGPLAPDEGEPATAEERPRAKIPETPREALVEALWARRAGGPGRQGVAPQVDPVPGREVTERERMAEPFVLLRDRPEEHHWNVGHIVLWLVIGALVAILGFLAYEVYVGNLELPPAVQRWIPLGKAAAPAAADAAKGGLAPKGAAVQPPVLADSLPFSVAIEAYPQYAPAVERAATLRREQQDINFFVTPALDHGSIYYHVMAGPVTDSLVAVALMQRLIDAGVKSGGSDFDIVATRLAFDLGDFASTGDAEARAAEMAQKNIPTYVVEVPVPGGPSRWRLYAGAFQGAADANVLRPLLRGAGVPDSLVPRIGRSPK